MQRKYERSGFRSHIKAVSRALIIKLFPFKRRTACKGTSNVVPASGQQDGS